MPSQSDNLENECQDTPDQANTHGHSSKGRTPQGSTRVMMTIPSALLKTTDDLAKADYMTRSDVVRQALTEYVRKIDNLEKLAAPITGQDVVLQRFLDKYSQSHPE